MTNSCASSLAAYYQWEFLRMSCLFIGRLWADAVQTWGSPERAQFLLLMVRDRRDVFASSRSCRRDVSPGPVYRRGSVSVDHSGTDAGW